MNNTCRSARAARALAVYLPSPLPANEVDQHDERQTALIDLLSDLRHYAASTRLDFSTAIAMSKTHFIADTRSES